MAVETEGIEDVDAMEWMLPVGEAMEAVPVPVPSFALE